MMQYRLSTDRTCPMITTSCTVTSTGEAMVELRLMPGLSGRYRLISNRRVMYGCRSTTQGWGPILIRMNFRWRRRIVSADPGGV